MVFFDTTNGTYLWIEQYEALCEAWIEAMEDGVRAPKISFLMNFHGGDANRRNTVTQLEVLYQLMFRPGKYRELWFYWEGKPLLMARYEDLIRKTGCIRKYLTSLPSDRGILPTIPKSLQRKTYGAGSVYIPKQSLVSTKMAILSKSAWVFHKTPMIMVLPP